MHVIWHGTASVEIAGKGGRILFDPFVPLPGSAVPVDISEFDGFTDIFVTHGHFDHISDLPKIIRRNPAVKIYCTGTPYRTLAKRGVPEQSLQLIHYGDVIRKNGFRIQAFHGRHAVLPKASFSRIAYILRSPQRTNIPHILRENRICVENDETVFYQVRAEGKTVCVMGSLNLRPEISYPEESDLLILPYNGWEDNFPPAEKIIKRLKPRRIVLDHYDDTFPPLTMPLDLSPILDAFPGKVTAMKYGKTETV